MGGTLDGLLPTRFSYVAVFLIQIAFLRPCSLRGLPFLIYQLTDAQTKHRCRGRGGQSRIGYERSEQVGDFGGEPPLQRRDPPERCVSSRDLGWASLLVEVHSGIAWNKAYNAVTTLDPRVSVHLSGHYLIHHSREAPGGRILSSRHDDGAAFR